VNVAAGLHVPGVTVNVEPTVAVPLIVGVGAVVNTAPGIAAAALVFVTGEKPAFVPVTLTVILDPPSAATNTYAVPVAPLIATPLRNHWMVVVVPVGVHVPTLTVNVDPTVLVPLIVGVDPVINTHPTPDGYWVQPSLVLDKV